MDDPLRVLIIEDQPVDAYLLVKHVQLGPIPIDYDIVCTRAELKAKLRSRQYDIIVCDYLLGDWTAIDAVHDCRESGFGGPFLVVSSSVGEELAADCIKHGACDFLLKSHLSRLPAVIEHTCELRTKQLRTEGARAELQLAEQRFRALIENSSDCVDIIDVDGRILWISPACMKVIGYTPEELVGKSALDFVHPADLKRGMNALRLCIESNTSVRVEFRLRHRDNRWIDVEVIACPHLDNPAIRGIVCNFRDTTTRKHAEEALLQSERHLRAVFEGASDGLVVLDADRTILDVNPSACEMFGKAKSQLSGLQLNALAEDNSEAMRFEQQLGQNPAFRGEISIVASGGLRKILDASVTSNFLPDKHLVCFRDVTEQRQLEESLRHASKLEAIGRLAGGVAHDFNNLLMVITSYAELASGLVDKDSQIASFLCEIHKATQRAASLTQQLLAFSRKQVLSPSVVDVNEVLAHAGEMLSRVIGEEITLIMDLADDVKPIVADRTQLEQVIVNLAVNARHAMPNGGAFRIKTLNNTVSGVGERRGQSIPAPEGDYVLIQVQDDGDGIPDEIQGKVFEPFFTTKPSGQGTGLGLATVYGIVQQSGGFIWLNSRVGHGTMFTIYFPVANDGQPIQPDHVASSSHNAGTETILLVEDEEQMLRAVSSYLRVKGYKVHEANGGEQALELARTTGKIDVLVTDVIMPGMDGRMLATEFSRIHPNAKIIYMTGYTDPLWASENDMLGSQALLRKPFTLDTLVQKIRSLPSASLQS